MRSFIAILGSLTLAAGLSACDGDVMMPPDAGPYDGGPFPPVSLDHCRYEDVPATGGAGGTVTSGALEAGIAERHIDVPLGASLAAFTGRAEGAGAEGFLPRPDARRTYLAGSFAPSVGIETIPRIGALALRAGGETVILIKLDIASSFQGFVHDVEANLGPEFSGKVIVATSHSHSSFGNYSGHSALHAGFGRFRSRVYERLITQMTETAQAAIADLRPAQIGFHHDGDFDPDDRVNRDRRDVNDVLIGRSQDDEHLFVIRVDAMDSTPMALIPVFGMHGTVQGGGNAIITTDSTGGVERVLREEFDSSVLVMHLQGAGGDVSPGGSRGTECADRPVCTDFARAETIGHYARDPIMAAYAAAGAAMRSEVELEMLTRTVALGPEASTFTIRDGALEYMPFDTRRVADAVVFDSDGEIISPIDEFNAPFGAALCNTDTPAIVQRAQMPGTRELVDLPYRGCMRIDQVDRVFERALDLDFEEPPICETTRTVVSALRIGEYLVGTLPGEPMTQLVDHIRQNLSPVAEENTIIVGYAQDHGGYLMRPEDWMTGGYEPSITFWGPLEGEYVAEQLGAIFPLVMTPTREDGNAEGMPRVSSPALVDEVEVDVSPLEVGSVPTSLPEYILTRLLRDVSSAQPAPTVPRLGTVFFTFVGNDPLLGTPRVFLQRQTAGVFEDVLRRSGRPVVDGAIVMTWTPDPIQREAGTPRTHYYTAEFQAVAPMGSDGVGALGARVGLPLGMYRFRIEGPDYDLTSDPFEVQPALISVAFSPGPDVSLDLAFAVPDEGFRLLDLGAVSNGLVPLRSQELSAVVDGGSPVPVTTDDAGQATLTGMTTGNTVQVLDAYGNATEVFTVP